MTMTRIFITTLEVMIVALGVSVASEGYRGSGFLIAISAVFLAWCEGKFGWGSSI